MQGWKERKSIHPVLSARKRSNCWPSWLFHYWIFEIWSSYYVVPCVQLRPVHQAITFPMLSCTNFVLPIPTCHHPACNHNSWLNIKRVWNSAQRFCLFLVKNEKWFLTFQSFSSWIANFLTTNRSSVHLFLAMLCFLFGLFPYASPLHVSNQSCFILQTFWPFIFKSMHIFGD